MANSPDPAAIVPCLASPEHCSDHEAALDRIAEGVTQSLLGRRGCPIGHLELTLTLDCNQDCDYCFVHGKRLHADMTPAIARRAVDLLLAMSGSLNTVTLLPFGGEPLLRFDLIQEVIAHARSRAEAQTPPKHVAFDLSTNGTLLDEKMMGVFRSQQIKVLISLDGSQSTHDRHRRKANGQSSYAAIVERLPMIRAYQPWLGTRMTVHPDAVDDMLMNYEHMAGLGINQFIIGPATGMRWAVSEWESYEQQMIRILRRFAEMRRAGMPLRVGMFERDIGKQAEAQKGRWGCGAGRGRIAVAPDGALYPCSKLLGVDALRDNHMLGDVWSGITEYRKRGELFAAGEEKRPTCRVCELKDSCTGGCPATNYEETGSLFLPSWLDCAQTRLMVRLRRELDEIGDLDSPPIGTPRHVRPL